MTTITALNVRLGMDVSNFSEGANLAKGEVTKVASIMRQSVPPAEKYKQELDLLNRAFSESGKKSKEYANALDFLQRKHKQTAASIDATAQATKNATRTNESAMASIKGMAAAYVSFQTVTKAIDLASQVEDATIAFEVLTGSAKDGAILFEQIRRFAAESPVTFSGAAQAAKTMISFGVAVQDVEQNLRMLSDVTGGNNDRFKMLSLAFSQMSAVGRLMGQDLLQMVNAGFNPLQQISKTTGESLIELKKRMEDGGISADEVRRAFQDATAEGGMFNGMTERLAQTVSGKLNIALSDLEQKLAEAGKALAPLIIQLLDVFQQMKPILDSIINLLDGISQGLGFTIAVWTDLINSISNFTIDMTATNKFLDELDRRDREQAAAAGQAEDDGFQQKLNNVDEAALAQMQADRQAAAEAKAAQEQAIKDQLKAQKDAAKQRLDDIEKERKARLRAIEDARKAQAKARQQAEEAFQRELESARADAMKFFEDQQKANEQRRADVAKGPGLGMEVGSAESVKFAADAVNAGIARKAVTDLSVNTNGDIAKKTAELVEEARHANQMAQQQIDLARKQLEVAEQNGFQRFR